jgi:hypothetical protein
VIRAAALAAALAACGCTSAGLSVYLPPEPAEPVVPARFAGEERPALTPTDHPGLYRAPSVDRALYYWEPDDLWYRRWHGRWYQAFDWNGAWFPPEQVPEPLERSD